MIVSRRYYRLSLLTAWSLLPVAAALAAQPVSTSVADPATLTEAAPADEMSPVEHGTTKPNEPLVVKKKFKDVDVNLIVNLDGSWLYSGHFKKIKDHDFEADVALKSSDGGVIVFQNVSDASQGEWSKQGESRILKDDFQTFSQHDFATHFHYSLTKEGRLKLFKEREEKRAQARKEEKEKIAKEQAAQAQRAQQSGSGGSSVWSTVLSAVESVTGLLTSIF